MQLQVVIFVFYDKSSHKVLSERRLPNDSFSPDKIVFPGGKVEKNETDNFEKTLLREAKEEFGVTPTEYKALSPLPGKKENVMLFPYAITKWQGKLPEVILDKGNAIIWQTFAEVASSEMETRRKIIAMLQDYLEK